MTEQMMTPLREEVWATYSVKDHLNPRALAADIMLFDRLVFPVPETAEFPENSGPPDERGAIEWKRNDSEWARWVKEGWDPDNQSRLLNLLQPVSRKQPWASEGAAYEQYRMEAARLAVQGLPDYAFVATRTILTRDLPDYVLGVTALGPAYRSLDEIARDLTIRRTDALPRLPGDVLATALAWEFFAPDPADTTITPEQLLTETITFVTEDAEFRNHRAAFWTWQHKFLRDGLTDRQSIERAIKDMRESLDAVNKAAKRLRIRQITRYATRIAPSAIAVVAAALGIPDALGIAAAGGILSIGDIVVEDKLFRKAEQGTPPATAFVLDARHHFGRQ